MGTPALQWLAPRLVSASAIVLVAALFTLGPTLRQKPSLAPRRPAVAPEEPAPPPAAAFRVTGPSDVEIGRYLVEISGCHDCHTPGAERGPQPREVWLTGSPVGWRGPWGTSYASNLRRFVAETPEDVWLTICRERNAWPPMPWASLHAMSDADLLAIHRFIASLGAAGEPAPAFLPPGEEPPPPYFLLDPALAARAATR